MYTFKPSTCLSNHTETVDQTRPKFLAVFDQQKMLYLIDIGTVIRYLVALQYLRYLLLRFVSRRVCYGTDEIGATALKGAHYR